jgi:hypothetical protein
MARQMLYAVAEMKKNREGGCLARLLQSGIGSMIHQPEKSGAAVFSGRRAKLVAGRDQNLSPRKHIVRSPAMGDLCVAPRS